MFYPFFSVSIDDFEKVSVRWVRFPSLETI